jgi:tripartite-type tricarboxylate transporter receptor subunit TctC
MTAGAAEWQCGGSFAMLRENTGGHHTAIGRSIMPHATRVSAVCTGSLVLVWSLLGAAPGSAESVAEFYKGKTISIVMGTGPGGSYDLYGRTIGEHLTRHIPGNPTIIMEHMPGAGGIIAGNYIYGSGPQDGTKMLLSHAIPLSEKLEPHLGVRFESAKFHWLGTYDSIVLVMSLWHTAPAHTIDELKTKDLIIGSFSKTHLTYQWPVLLKNVLHAKYKVITGYRSGNDLNLAMERGEIHGWTVSWANLAGTRPDWLRDKKVNMLVQFAFSRIPHLPKVPTLLELTPPDQKDVVEFLTAGTPFARALAVGPDVPADRVAALRTAFDDLMKDQAFLADAKKRKLDIDPRNAREAQAMVEKIAHASPELVARVKKAIGGE